MAILFFAVSLLASIVGAVCGIGGGVIIKPVLDLTGAASVSAISFLSGCTVLSMSCYSVGRSLYSRESGIEKKTGTPLAIGAAVGGVAGKALFDLIKSLFSDPDRVGAVQAACLGLITIGTLLYTLKKEKISTHSFQGIGACCLIGIGLGIMSSFLGIGGGPINLVVLSFFFSMDTKKAAQNSLYIILFSQAASLLSTILTGRVPDFSLVHLILMVLGGILGGIIGRKVNKRLDNRAVDKLFIGLMAVIILICFYNYCRYSEQFVR